MTRIRMAAIMGALGLLLAAGTVQAQLYHYKDANGRMVYSDSPPPPNIPAGNIMKAPKMGSAAASAPASDAPAAADKDKKTGPKSVAEQEADYKKRQADDAKKAKENSDKVAQEDARKTRCAALQNNLTAMQAGQRLRKYDAAGNPYFVEDAERASDIAKAQADMAAAKC